MPKARTEIDLEFLSKKKWLTADELSVYLSLSIHTIRERVENNSIPFNRIPGSHLLRFNRERIDQWMEAGK